MNSPPPGWLKPRSSTDSTRMPRLTLARIGLRAASNASSVMENSVTRTGTIRFLLQTKRVSADSIGTISSVPAAARALLASSCRAGRIDHRLQGCERGKMPTSVRFGTGRGLELVRRVDLGVQLDGLRRRALEPQRLGVVGVVLPRGLDLQRAAQCVRVVLQRDDPAPPTSSGRSAPARP